jgi:PDZ domain
MRFWPLLFLLILTAPLHAQDEPVHMRPEFPLIFPLTQIGKDGKDVSVKYPVMINPGAVIKPGMRLRVLYILSQDSTSGSADLAVAHSGTMEQAYARNAFGANGSDAGLPPGVLHEIEGYRRTVWEVSNNFVLAMAQYPTDAMHLIYTPTDKDQNLHDERFSFFDGLFVGMPNGKVAVIAVEKESKADKAGVKAGDEIVSVGGIPTRDDLATFASAYASAKKTAKENEVDSYPMTLLSDGGEKTVNIPLPPRIQNGLMNDFFNQPPPSTSSAPAPTPSTAPAH